MLVKRPRKPKGWKRPDHWKKPGPLPLQTVVLEQAHRLGKVVYGPGEVRVRSDIARELLCQQEAVQANRLRALNPREAMIGIRYTPTGGLITVPVVVPSGHIDDAISDTLRGHMAPAFHLTGADWRPSA